MKNLNGKVIYLWGIFFVSMAMGSSGDIPRNRGNLESTLVPTEAKTLSLFLEECKNRAFFRTGNDLDGEGIFESLNSSIWEDEALEDAFEGMEIIREIRNAQEIIMVIRDNRERYGSDLVELAKDFRNLNADFANAVLTVAMVLENNVIINEILFSGYAFNWQNGNILGFSPLQYAIFLKKIDYLNIFLKYDGVDVNFFDYKGRTLLMFAILKDDLFMVELLLNQANIELNLVDEKGRTALNYAKKSEKREIISLIKNHGGSEE
ncbi:MAG: ankyrin repeat domain-containing protein [Puniceicoccales bacterium]|jgi:hypothetical protein|nr:ankyrin repeat domain-containing protein [Puniceicoccales bacterium]